VFDRVYRFHDLLTVQVRSSRRFYADFFDREFQGCRRLDRAEDIDLRVEIDFPEHRRAGNWAFDHRFRRLFRARYSIEGWDETPTILRFASDASFYLYPLVMGAFLQTMLVEPLIYWKGLHQGFILAHSASVDLDGRGTLISAVGGGGKTTLSLRLVNQGYGFLGDDLAFVTPDGRILAYPRPLHLFTYVTRQLDFLRLRPKTVLVIRLKDVIRAVISRLLNQRFLISTRVDFSDAVPDGKMVSSTTLENLLALSPSGTVERIDLEDRSEREALGDRLIQNGEINEILKTRLLPDKARQDWAADRESGLIKQLLLQVKKAFRVNTRAVSADEIRKILE